MPLLNDPGHKDMTKFLTTRARSLLSLENAPPRAILLVTAHWETGVPTISSGDKHALYYDYYGFPKETYAIKYDAPGSPEVAQRVKEVLTQAGFAPRMDPKRGWDHGVFVPLTLLWPKADVPIVQMSVLENQDAEEHLRMGKALAKLRDENVMILGSGMTFQ